MSKRTFTRYEVFIIAILTFLQFTVVLDFMVLSPLGVLLMPEMKITEQQFAMVVSGYAFSAGASGLLAAGFADSFDRKKMLLFFYAGFIIGTLCCAMAQTFPFLLAARIVTGIFGGVMGSIAFAIITDLFPFEVRGRVMGFLQTALSGAQVMGIPVGIYLANHWGWHSTFFMIVAISIPAAMIIIVYMKPIDEHLKVARNRGGMEHLVKTVSDRRYIRGFAATALLATGGFMLMPFGSTFAVKNLGIASESLPMLYMIPGMASLATGPLIGRFTDSVGKYKMFFFGSILTIIMVVIYCNLESASLWMLVGISVLMFSGVIARMISSQALISGVPDMPDRGAFMAINTAVQQISGGIATVLAGFIVVLRPDYSLGNYPLLGYVVVTSVFITIVMMYFLDRHISKKMQHATPATVPPVKAA